MVAAGLQKGNVGLTYAHVVGGCVVVKLLVPVLWGLTSVN
jgi:hypothetical protein